jgi:signal transduction histidine kinase
MGRSLDALYRLLDELLEWARADAALDEFRPNQLELGPAIDNCFRLLRSQAELKGVRLEALGAEGVRVRADPRMFDTLLRNLVGNGLKFTDFGGLVAVSAHRSRSKTGVRLTVSDSGIGISPAALRVLYETGKIPQRPGTDGEPGTGLGVALCKRIMERHGGHLDIESVEGSGSIFAAFFPDASDGSASS